MCNYFVSWTMKLILRSYHTMQTIMSSLQIMLTGIRECQVPEIRSNLIRMTGLLALLLVNSLNDTTATVISTITEFILEQAHKENDVWVLAEAIDTIVDLYSGDDTDALAAKIKLVEKLQMLSPILKNKVCKFSVVQLRFNHLNMSCLFVMSRYPARCILVLNIT